MRMPIKNNEIEKYRNLLIEIYKDTSQNKQTRLNAATKVKIINAIVGYYEQGYEIEYEDLSWNEMGRPLLPEEFEELSKNLEKQLEKLNEKDMKESMEFRNSQRK
jgi:hypothetical protein